MMKAKSSFQSSVMVFDSGQYSYKYQQELLNAQNLEEIGSILQRISQEIIPFTAFKVISYDYVSETYSVLAEWSRLESWASTTSSTCWFDGCKPCHAEFTERQENFALGCCDGCHRQQNSIPRFCLPLVFSKQSTAVLHLYLSKAISLAPFQLNLIDELAPLIARSYQTLHQKQELNRLTEIAAREKKEIARYLHDSLSSSLAYLRLKLELLSEQSCDQKHPQEAVRLARIADQCYASVRDLLAHLFDDNNNDSPVLFDEYIQQLRESVDFQINFTIHNMEQDLPKGVQRSVYGILREVFHNIEKHANASSVNVTINIDKHAFHLKISDDGCGFDPQATMKRGGHFGLRIIREYVEEGQGLLSVSSSPGSGTTISIQLPIKEDIELF